MRKVRTALLVAAATLAGMPALVVAQTPPAGSNDGRPDHNHGDHGNRGDRGDGGGYRDRGARAPVAAPAQAQPSQVRQSAPPQAQPQIPPQQAQPPRAQPPQGQAPQWQGHGDGRPGPGRQDGDRGRPGDRDDGFRNGFRPGDGRADPRFGSDGRGFQGGYAGRPDDRGRPGSDHGGSDRGGQGWDRGGAWNRDHGSGGWRSDRRYDWRGWRDRNRALFHGPHYQPPRGYGYGYRAFSPGFRLEPFFYDRSYWIDDPDAYRLPPAYGPYRWVRYYDDVLLVDLRSGTVVDVIRDFFW